MNKRIQHSNIFIFLYQNRTPVVSKPDTIISWYFIKHQFRSFTYWYHFPELKYFNKF